MNDILHYLSEHHTPQGVKYSIYHQLKAWLEPGHTSSYMAIDAKLISANDQQRSIGRRQFTRGRLPIIWGEIINDQLVAKKISDITAEQWGTNLVHTNWKYI
jgi:hypothetical protein